jgi:protein TonB
MPHRSLALASTVSGLPVRRLVLHIIDVRSPVPMLPTTRGPRVVVAFVCAASLQVSAAFTIVAGVSRLRSPALATELASVTVDRDVIRDIVFIPRDPIPSGGGGGGGNRQAGPIRHGHGIGSDSITLRIAVPATPAGTATDTTVVPEVLLDAKSLASGNVDEIGLPVGGVSYGTSTGLGSGGGVGEGVGTGVGTGRGPGVGPGSGGGTGGGVYRPGGSVTAPRVITEVKPTYTDNALAQKIQGTVVLELVVRSNGRPSDIRIVQSLDPGGLDQQAIIAAGQWRFEPGQLSGRPVDVIVTIMLDFWIR